MRTIYLRREPAADNKDKFDVVAYANHKGTGRLALWPWFYTTRPTKRNKYVWYNCDRYKVIWI